MKIEAPRQGGNLHGGVDRGWGQFGAVLSADIVTSLESTANSTLRHRGRSRSSSRKAGGRAYFTEDYLPRS